jgi:hypothetical protein
MKHIHGMLVGSVVGAVAIHFGIVACGSGGGTSSDPTASAYAALGNTVLSAPAPDNGAQLVRGNASGLAGGGAGVILVTGPFVLTDATSGSGAQAGSDAYGAFLVVQPTAASCPALTGGQPEGAPGYVATVYSTVYSVQDIHGGRYLVPSGSMLCAYGPGGPLDWIGEVQWAGFRPYE